MTLMRECVHPIDVDVPKTALDEALQASDYFFTRGRIQYRFCPGRALFERCFQTDNLESSAKTGFLVTRRGRNSSIHTDDYKVRNPVTGENEHRCRGAAINIPVQPEGELLVFDDDRREIGRYTFGKPIILNTSKLHQAVNRDGGRDRIIFSVSFYQTSFDELVALHKAGRLLR